MPKTVSETLLTRRERQIMDILFASGQASGQEIQEKLDGQPSYSTVRTILRILEKKGVVRHREEGLRYIYQPVISRDAARRSALRRLLQTFFDGSARNAMAALLDPKAFPVSRKELDEIGRMIDKAKERKA